MEPYQSVLGEAEAIINGARREAYGPAEKSFAVIAMHWSAILDMSVTPAQVVLCMIALKMVRYGQSQGRDSVVDMAGYAGCLEKIDGDKW